MTEEYINAWWDGEQIATVLRRDGKRRLKKIPGEHSCYVRSSDFGRDVRRQLSGHKMVAGIKTDGDWVRIKFVDSWARRRIAQDKGWLSKQGVKTYEADLRPVHRWLADHDVKIGTPGRAYVDIETDSRLSFDSKEDMRVLCWSVVSETGDHLEGTLESFDDEDEKRLLTELIQELRKYDQLIAWNGDKFDFPVIKARCDTVGVEVDFRRWLFLDHMVLFQKMNTMAAESGAEKQSMALNSVAMHTLGEGKDDVDASKAYQMWEEGGAERDRLVKYCHKDTDLMRRIENETGYIELFQTVCEVCGIFPDSYGLNATRQVDGFMLRLGRERNLHFESKTFGELEKSHYSGAFVLEPTERGIVKDVHVADFAGLYPSIILTWNLSPEMRVPKETVEIPEGVCEVPITGVRIDTRKKGVLPEALESIIELRKVWKKRKAECPPGTPESKAADRKSTAYKIVANSFYGVMGAPSSRFFCREIAESTSQGGVWLIKNTIREAERRGMSVIYGDTDSIFVRGCGRTEFEEFVAWCNADLYPRILKEQGCARNEIKLDYEKAFSRLVLIRKKRYFARFSHYKGTEATSDSKPEVKGIEYNRGDVIKLCRSMQREAVEMLLSDRADFDKLELYVEFTEKWLKRVLTGQLELDDVVVSKKVTRGLDEYSSKIKKDGTNSRLPPHVEIAMELRERGFDVSSGTRIPYFVSEVVKGTRMYKHADQWKGECDRYDLWESSIWPASRRVLEAAFPGHAWKEYNKIRPTSGRMRAIGRGRRVASQFLGLDKQGDLFAV